jgi:hypothetical protein
MVRRLDAEPGRGFQYPATYTEVTAAGVLMRVLRVWPWQARSEPMQSPNVAARQQCAKSTREPFALSMGFHRLRARWKGEPRSDCIERKLLQESDKL